MIPTTSRSTTPRNDNPSLISSSTIRPRNKRFISVNLEQELVSTNVSGTSTSRGSRAVSPIPARHPSRAGEGRAADAGGRDSVGRAGGAAGGSGGWGWDNNWASKRLNAFQEVAFGMLGGGVGSEGNADGRRTLPPPKKEGWFASGKTPIFWGPESLPQKKDQGVGMGSTEARDAEVRARRRARVLEGRDEGVNTLDTNGNYKARTSIEETRPGSSHNGDHALVYIHHVEPNDTVQGVVLKYHCQMDVFKKANRFWAGDSIQVRKTVFLPVDACAIKGRPCEPPTPNSPQGIDLLAPTPSLEESPFPNGSTWGAPLNGTSAEHSEDEESPYVHVRWVLLDASPNSKPIEIVRIPRKTLNYFPPRRRKSHTTLSTVSTPRVSSELLPSTSSTPSQTSNLGPRPNHLSSSAIGSYFPPPALTMPPARSRRESVGETADRMGWLRGPGGVGTLGKSVRKPGPGKDILNSWTNKHIPSLAIDSLPSSSVLGPESAHLGFDHSAEGLGRIAEGGIGAGAGAGGNGIGFPSLSLGAGSASVESWVRKIAQKATSVGPGTPRQEPVLIEMLDGTGSDDGRGFELDPGSGRTGTPLGGTGRETVKGLVGRRAAGKGGKGD